MGINEHIREFLLSFRKEKGLTQDAMSQLLGIKLRTYAKIDKTGDIKTVEDVYSIIEHTGMDLLQMIAYSKGKKIDFSNKKQENDNSDPPHDLLKEKDERIQEQKELIAYLRAENETLKKATPPKRTGTDG